MSTIQHPDIPSEIIDAVVDHVQWGDPSADATYEQQVADKVMRQKTLGRCSLVSKSWLTRSRYHLFTSILSPSRHLDLDEWMELLVIVDSPLSTIAPFVRTMNLNVLSHQNAKLPQFCALLARLTGLTTVETLSISMAHFGAVEIEEASIIFGGLPKLRHLMLDLCTFATSLQLVQFLSANPCLRQITLGSLIFERPGSHHDLSELQVPSHLKTLEIHALDDRGTILEWLTSSKQTSALDALELNNLQAVDSRAVAVFLRMLGGSLKSLCVCFFNKESSSTDSQGAFITNTRPTPDTHFLVSYRCILP